MTYVQNPMGYYLDPGCRCICSGSYIPEGPVGKFDCFLITI